MDKEKVIEEGQNDFAINRQYLESELKAIIDGKATFIDIDEAECRLKSTIKKFEDSLQR